MLRRIHSCIAPQTDRQIVTEAGVQRRADFYLLVPVTLVRYALTKHFLDCSGGNYKQHKQCFLIKTTYTVVPIYSLLCVTTKLYKTIQ